jgi:hypothetical protein
MFEALFDELSYLGAWRWPVAQGAITEVEVERIQHSDGESWRLSVTYKFSVGADGPYTGESFWQPTFSWNAMGKLRSARRELHIGHPVQVRYRADDPSINKLDGGVRKMLNKH